MEDYEAMVPFQMLLMVGHTVWGEMNETFSNAHEDGNLVTVAAWPARPEWMRKFLELLGTRIEP